jgi:hypothetical protein
MAGPGDDDVHMEDVSQDKGQPDFRTMSRRQQFKAACVFGPEGLLRLCLYHDSIPKLAGWSWDSVRTMVDRYYRVAVPLTDLVTRLSESSGDNSTTSKMMTGPPVSTEGLCEPDMNALQIITYGELFGQGLREWYVWNSQRNQRQDNDIPPTNDNNETSFPARSAFTPDQAWLRQRSADIGLRMEFVKYCLSDYRVLDTHHDQQRYVRETEWGDEPTIWEERPTEYPSSPRPVFVKAFEDWPSLQYDDPDVDVDTGVSDLIAITTKFGPYGIAPDDGSLNLGRRENCGNVSLVLRTHYLWTVISDSVRHSIVGPTEIGPSHRMLKASRPRWRQLLWENALTCAGWGGAELMAEAWAKHEENNKARMLEERRGVDLDPRTTPSHTAQIDETRSQLLMIYQYIQAMADEPEKITVRRRGTYPHIAECSVLVIPDLPYETKLARGW